MPKFKATSVIKSGWGITKENVVFLAGLTIVLFVAQMIVSYVLEALQKGGYSLVFIILQILVSVASVIIGMGVLWITIKIVRKESFEISDITVPLPHFFRYIGVNLLYGFITLVGLILLIVPGIIWALKYSQVRFLIIDGKLGIKEVFSKSARMTDGSKMELFVLYILLGLLNFAGALLFGIGLLITVPLSMIVTAFVYDLLLKADTAVPASPAPESSVSVSSPAPTI